jgi:hypothetical protein
MEKESLLSMTLTKSQCYITFYFAGIAHKYCNILLWLDRNSLAYFSAVLVREKKSFILYSFLLTLLTF